MTELKQTPLLDLHKEMGARLVPFAGYEMPVQYTGGIIAEHRQCRTQAALFDVSHMGQIIVKGEGADQAMEALVPGDLQKLPVNKTRYTMLTNEAGGIIDDIMITKIEDGLFVVVNAAGRDQDIQIIRDKLGGDFSIEELNDHALVALQGPSASTVLGRLAPEAPTLKFMESRKLTISGIDCRIGRQGYTGEDGYEISMHADHAMKFVRTLLAAEEAAPAGLGARDSLRLEAGLCLHGHDIDAHTTPIEAQLNWTISKRRRAEGGFPGASVIQRQLAEGPVRKLVGLRPEGRAPAREGTEIQSSDGKAVGTVTSGGFGPTLGGPVALGYVDSASAAPETMVNLLVRGKTPPATVIALPFVPHNYHR